MKLYTEEQVREAYNKGRTDWIEEIEDCNILSDLTPIELPSDEEIEKESSKWIAPSQAFRKGAKWIKEQILNQNK